MKVVPEDVSTAPLVLTCPLPIVRGPQLTATRVGNIIIHTVIHVSARLTWTGGCGKTPGSTSLTGSSGSTTNHVPKDTGVSGHLIKGGS